MSNQKITKEEFLLDEVKEYLMLEKKLETQIALEEYPSINYINDKLVFIVDNLSKQFSFSKNEIVELINDQSLRLEFSL